VNLFRVDVVPQAIILLFVVKCPKAANPPIYVPVVIFLRVFLLIEDYRLS